MVVIDTDRLILRHARMDDVPALERVYCDPAVMRYGMGVKTPDEVQERLRTWIETEYPTWGFGKWVVVLKKTVEVIGYCGLTRYEGRAGADEAELAYRFIREFWGNGYATEAAQAACDYGFHSLGLRRIIAYIDLHNTASVHVAKKLGMTFEREYLIDGYTHPDHVYELSHHS